VPTREQRAIEKNKALLDRLHKAVASGEIKTVSRKQVVAWAWHPRTGIVYTQISSVADRISGLWARFGGSKLQPIGPLRGREADPWVYFSIGRYKYRTPLYND